MATAYGISSYDSNAMKSSNPHSGIYEAETSRTLDGNGGNPSCNQGGIAVVEKVPYTLKIRGGVAVDSMGKAAGKGALIQEDLSATLGVSQDQYLFQPVYSVENHPNDSRVGINEDGKVQALTSRMGTGGGNVPMVMQCYSKSKRAQTATDNETWVESETANTLNAFDVGDVRTTECVVALDRASFNQGKNAQYDFEVSTKGVNSPLVAKGPSAVCYSVDQGGGKSGCDVREGKAPTLTTTHDGAPAVCYSTKDCRNGTEDEVNGALQSNSAHSLNGNNVVRTRYIVRRLTPLECERLQGYPDGWTDIGEYIDSNGKKRQTSDAARYKALGNSIALPPWKWVLKRLCACYERDATMASLFDGIGGFPYLWEQLNGKGSCRWASEIEEFPMAVTKVRIGE
jgi:site-specific DNA-cytosine methylase